MKKNSLTIRSVTFAAVAGLSLGIAAPGAIAVAEESILQNLQGDEDDNVKKANIDFTKTGSLTLHKKKGAESEKMPPASKWTMLLVSH